MDIARRVYAAAHQSPVEHVTEDDATFVAAIQAILDEQEPCELRQYDPDYDDRRGGSYHERNYRTRSQAQARADELNEDILRRLNDERRGDHATTYNTAVRRVTEHNALFDASLRLERMPEPVVPEFVLFTIEDLTEGELVEGRSSWDTGLRRRWPKEHYFVRAIDFDD